MAGSSSDSWVDDTYSPPCELDISLHSYFFYFTKDVNVIQMPMIVSNTFLFATLLNCDPINDFVVVIIGKWNYPK